MSISQKIKELLKQEAEAISTIPVSSAYDEAVELIHRHVHKRGGKIICSGMGKAGQIAINIATTFSSTGTPAVFLHPSDAQHGDLGVMQQHDVLFLISNSGKTREILELVALARKLVSGIPLVVITGNSKTDLTSQASVVLHTGDPPEVCPLGLTPTTSTTTMTVIGDILVVLMMNRIGFTAEDYARRHHGGYLGDRSRGQSVRIK